MELLAVKVNVLDSSLELFTSSVTRSREIKMAPERISLSRPIIRDPALLAR